MPRYSVLAYQSANQSGAATHSIEAPHVYIQGSTVIFAEGFTQSSEVVAIFPIMNILSVQRVESA